MTAGLSLLSVSWSPGSASLASRRRPERRPLAHAPGRLACDRREPVLRVVIGLFSAQTFVAGMLKVLVVVLAIEFLDLGTAGVGWLDGMIGIGATLGVLAVAGLAGRRRLARYFALGQILWGVPLLLLAAWPEAAPALVLLGFVGIGNTLVDVTGITLLQRAAADAVLGRVFGAFEALVLLSMALGSLVAPPLVASLGTRGAVLVAGLILPVILIPLWRPLSSIDAAAEVSTGTDRASPRRSDLRAAPRAGTRAPRRGPRRGRVEAGATVFGQGDAGDRLYVIDDGRAEVETVRALDPGDVFGEIALLRDVPRTATVRAVTAAPPLRTRPRDLPLHRRRRPASAAAAGSIVAARLPGPVIS